MDLREEFVLKALGPGANMAELCREYGISRKTGHKWRKRYLEVGMAGLEDESRRPRSSPLEVSGEMVLDVIALRTAHPTWGPTKITRLLAARPGAPSRTTVARILKRANLVKKRRQRSTRVVSIEPPQIEVNEPNDLWTVDFKGWWNARNGERCEPLTVRDAHSRYVLTIDVLAGTHSKPVRESFERAFDEYGVPKAILRDNGQPFACTRALAGLTQLSAWWVSLGMELYRSRPGCPQDNGAHERMHRDVCAELEAHPASNRAQEQARCDYWRDEFNRLRPHEALGLDVPEAHYRPSELSFSAARPRACPAICDVRRVQRNGTITYAGEPVFVSRALADRSVGVEYVTDHEARVWFHHLLLGQFEPRKSTRVDPIPAPDQAKEDETKDAE